MVHFLHVLEHPILISYQCLQFVVIMFGCLSPILPCHPNETILLRKSMNTLTQSTLCGAKSALQPRILYF